MFDGLTKQQRIPIAPEITRAFPRPYAQPSPTQSPSRPQQPPVRPRVTRPSRPMVQPAAPAQAAPPQATPGAARPVPAQSQGTKYGEQIDGWPEGLQPFTAQYKNFDGTMSNQPNFGQRDAFISQLISQLGQMQSQSWDKPGMGAPQFNFPSMWNQAGKMVQQGWQNPFAMR